MNESVRLNKYIAECGVCSRREADKLIEGGSVMINGNIALMGSRVSAGDIVTVDGKRIERINNKVVLAYNKPIGVTCTEKDKHAEITIKDVLDYPIRVTYAGRLDKESEGLILMTNDGELINALMKGHNEHEKEYIVTVNGKLSNDFKKKMENGIFLKELNTTTRKCKVNIINQNTFNIILTQGLNRQIRRMCETQGLKVTSLIRVRVGNIELGKLKSGTYRKLTTDELAGLYKLVNL